MKCVTTVLLVFALSALAVSAAGCPKACSNHGDCDTDTNLCACELGYLGADCSLQGKHANLTDDDTLLITYGLQHQEHQRVSNTLLYVGFQWTQYNVSLPLGYASIGWGANDSSQGMADVSMIVVNSTADGGKVWCTNYLSTGHKRPATDPIQDCVVVTSHVTDMEAYVQIKRPMRADDERDQHVFSGSIVVSYALGKTMDFQYHYGPHGTAFVDFTEAPLLSPAMGKTRRHHSHKH